MHRGHGHATRLTFTDLDLRKIDQAIDDGGRDREAVRMLQANRFLGPNRFGRMFSGLDRFRPSDESLVELASAMRETAAPPDRAGDNPLPSGYTYLGQFIDHDLTFDTTEGFPEIDDPAELESARSLTLDLDSLYGLGPVRQPELYDPAAPPWKGRFRIGTTSSLPSPGAEAFLDIPHDLPRRPNRSPIIGDVRNDENLLIAQTHLAFLKFHNAVLRRGGLSDDGPDADGRYTKAEEERSRSLFLRARRTVRWHYQWIVLHDFLPRMIDQAAIDDVLAHGRRFYRYEDEPFGGTPYMPVEFSVAAYRFGHSLIRSGYNHNRVFNFGGPPALVGPGFDFFFSFTGNGGFGGTGASRLPSNWVIDWRRFYDLGRPELVNPARKINTEIAAEMHALPTPGVVGGAPVSLPERNLLRGSRMGLPTGQAVAEAIGAQALTPAELGSGPQGEVVRRHSFDTATPLFYYILKEAELQGDGNRLGAVGSRILAEVFVGLLQAGRYSFLRVQPDWRPTLPAATPGHFTMADLLRFTGEENINPLGPGPEGP